MGQVRLRNIVKESPCVIPPADLVVLDEELDVQEESMDYS